MSTIGSAGVARNEPPEVTAERILGCATAEQANATDLPLSELLKAIHGRIQAQRERMFQIAGVLEAVTKATSGQDDSVSSAVELAREVADNVNEALDYINMDLDRIQDGTLVSTNNVTPIAAPSEIPPSTDVRIEELRQRLLTEAMPFIGVTMNALNPDDHVNERTVLWQAFEVMDEVASALNEISSRNGRPDSGRGAVMSAGTASTRHNAEELPSRETIVKRIEEQCDRVFQAQAIVRVVGDLLHAQNDEADPPGSDRTKLGASLSMSVAEEMLEKIAADLGGMLKADD
jgi:hypothetical protein